MNSSVAAQSPCRSCMHEAYCLMAPAFVFAKRLTVAEGISLCLHMDEKITGGTITQNAKWYCTILDCSGTFDLCKTFNSSAQSGQNIDHGIINFHMPSPVEGILSMIFPTWAWWGLGTKTNRKVQATPTQQNTSF